MQERRNEVNHPGCHFGFPMSFLLSLGGVVSETWKDLESPNRQTGHVYKEVSRLKQVGKSILNVDESFPMGLGPGLNSK